MYNFKRTIKRFAHVNGYTCVTYSEDGDIITSGSDGDIRIWKDISDDDPVSQCIGENGNYCIQYSNNQTKRLFASSENVVLAYKFPEFEKESVDLRFSDRVTTLKVNKTWVAAGSEDSNIKVLKLNTNEPVVELKGHKGPILHIDLSEKNHLASSSCDGTIRIWNIETKEVIKSFDGFEQYEKFSDTNNYCTPVFEKSGRYLAFPKQNLINIVDITNWEIKFKLENNEITNFYSVCSFSYCGSYLAAGTLNGEISVWSLADNAKLKGDYFGEENHSITSIEWNPNNNEVAFCDFDGQLSTVKLKQSNKMTLDNEIDENSVEDNVDDPDDIYGQIDFRGGEEEDAEDEKNENCIALEKLKNETLKNDSDSDDDSKTVKSELVSERYAPIKPFILQPPFQPGSTPEHLEHRYMVWNHIGQVLCHNSSEENSIIVEFHDANLHPSLHILNNLNHQMASLSSTCLALASKTSPSKVVCIALLSSGNKEWSQAMPNCEEIQAIAAGNTFVAVATDAGFIRIFTTMGTQREIVMIPGPVVCLSADENKLIVAYHTSNSCNKYSIMIINIMGLLLINRTIELPSTKDSKLSWLGFSDCGSIIAYESTGRLLSYSIKKNIWMPICDLTDHVIGASDRFFMISVSEKLQKIRASLCRGTNFPLTNPRPIMREIDYALPMCNMESEKTKLEELLIRSFNFDVESSNKFIVENGLKLFSTAINSELESRAYEIVELINDKKLIELASKYACQKGRMHMSSKISKLLNTYEEKELEKKSAINDFEKNAELFTEIYEESESKRNEEKDKREESTPLITPRPMISQRKSNPFKKSMNNSGVSAISALNHLTKKSIGYTENTATSDDENIPSNNISKTNRSISLDTPRPGNFGQWFIANKEDLKLNYPDINDAELMKIGRDLYKELTQKTKMTSDEASLNTSVSLNKRKLDLNDESGGMTKLAKFACEDK